MDETYIKVRGQWEYLCPDVDSTGQTTNFLLNTRRDAVASLRFLQAIRHHGVPEESGANTAALGTLNAGRPEEVNITIRQNKYLNNRVEQAHRNIKNGIS